MLLFQADPLKFFYFVLLGTDDPMEVTPFQGFSDSWESQGWALDMLQTLPADVGERSLKVNDIVAQRIGGLRPTYWIPLNISALEQLSTPDLGPLSVCFSGELDCARRTATWAKKQPHPILHISTEDVEDACKPEEFTFEKLRAFSASALEKRADELTDERRQYAKSALEKWTEHQLIESGLVGHGHNVLKPNYMSLTRSFRSVVPGEPFLGETEKEYSDAITESAEAIVKIRDEIGIKPLHFLSPPRAAIVLAEPALYRAAYRTFKPQGPFEERAVARTLRRIQTQKGLHNRIELEDLKEFTNSPAAQSLLAVRRSELDTFTSGVGLFAAQTASAVVRMSPAVNHVFPALSFYAMSVRSQKIESRLKARRLFGAIQNGLRDAVGPERIALIEKEGGPIKIVADPPIEWLPIRGLPMSMRYNCSRLNATPGNLLMGQLASAVTLTFKPADLQKVLVVSSFEKDDPLRNAMTGAINAVRHQWEGKAEIVFRTASTVEEFKRALNEFDGCILIFDGHGADNAKEPVGKLAIGNDLVDVWDLRGHVRTPPIVILSACDTHGIDASSQATVGNGFLFLGARTVVATLLPVGGEASALFVSRLIYRLADFLPAALNANKRVLEWTEVIAGMLRMSLASELLDDLVGPPAPLESPRIQLQLKANMYINADGDENWYERLLADIAEHRGQGVAVVATKAASIVARSDAIRYVQLGNPETILIDDGRIRKKVLSEYGRVAEG